MRLNFKSVTYRDSNDTFGERSVTDLMRFEIQIHAEFNTTAAGRELITLLTETSLCLFVFRWARRNILILITKDIYNYEVSDIVRKSTVTTGSFFFLLVVVVIFSICTSEM